MAAMTESAPYLNLHVPPDEMVKYIQDLMTLPHGEIAATSAMTLAQRLVYGVPGFAWSFKICEMDRGVRRITTPRF